MWLRDRGKCGVGVTVKVADGVKVIVRVKLAVPVGVTVSVAGGVSVSVTVRVSV